MTMRAASVERLMRDLSDDDLVLDVGGWIEPFMRADWVIDVMPYEGRGPGGRQGAPPECFTRETWVQRDICDRKPWPFENKQFDFAICAHTLEDIRDPVWVCSELIRVARAGYIEVPSRLEEQSYGFQGEWVGWGHHRWLIDITDNRIDFVFKHHVINREVDSFPSSFYKTLSEDEKAQTFWWEGSFEYREHLLLSAEELDPYLAEYVAVHHRASPMRDRTSRFLRRLADRIR